jgi:hypothetical protein
VVLISKDSDFVELVSQRGPPPKLLCTPRPARHHRRAYLNPDISDADLQAEAIIKTPRCRRAAIPPGPARQLCTQADDADRCNRG